MRTGKFRFVAAAVLGFWSAAGLAQDQPLPEDPYPLAAAGWGPEAGNGFYYSRWAEDWTAMRVAGTAPSLKALPLGKGANLTLSTETRLRFDTWENSGLARGDDYQQGLFRNVLGADLRFNPGLRLYTELGSGHVGGRRGSATAGFENDNSLQQLFVDARTTVRAILVGTMLGRQEFADGPRQLVSLGDGSNLHRTWNGARLYLHGERFRVGAFDLRATRLGRGDFDERIERGERLQGLNASVVIARDSGEQDIYLDPFWIRSTHPAFHSGEQTGADDRHTLGARLWGTRSALKFDVTLAHQSGQYVDRDVDAWGFFAMQGLMLVDAGWKPRITARVDAASGAFNPLYSSSNYLGEGRFLALNNLLLIAPGLSVSPGASTSLAIEYGFARRFKETDAVHAGGMRTYAGTADVPGRQIGGLLRMAGTWTGTWWKSTHVTVTGGFEHLAAGNVLERAQLHSGSYGYVSTTFRY